MTAHATKKRDGGARARIYHAAVRLFAERGSDAVTVSDLADAAGIARGTIYNNIVTPENLFGEVAASLAHEMMLRTDATMREIKDPAERVATGIRLFVRRANEEQDWGRFLTRFALEHSLLHKMMREPPARDIRKAIRSKTFSTNVDSIPALVSMLAGTTLAAMSAVLHGEQTWRSAGDTAAELFLIACGAHPAVARRLSSVALPPLASAIAPTLRHTQRKPP